MDRSRRGAPRGGRRGRRPQTPPALPREAAEDVRAAAGGKGNRAVTHLEEAVAALDRGRPEDAVRAAQQAKALAPRSGAVREVLGMALYRRGRHPAAPPGVPAHPRGSPPARPPPPPT